MTQIKETVKEGLKREFNITVPQDDVKQKLQARLKEIGQSVRLPGFRPGKVPMPVLEQRFAAGARSEVIDQTVSETAQQALKEHNLRPAAQPQIELISFGEGKDLEFKLALEIIPEIALGDFSKILLERITSDVEDKTVDEAIQKLAKSVHPPEEIKDARGAKTGDTLVIDFDGSVDGEAKPGMKGNDQELELGSKSFIDNFEEQLEGSKPGDEKVIHVKFPKEYHASELADKKAEFKVKIKAIKEPAAIVLNDDLAKALGLESFTELKSRVTADLAANYGRVTRAILKRHLLDALASSYDFELPKGMVEAEFGSIWKQVEESKKAGQLQGADAEKSEDELRKDYRLIAERRVRLGLLLTEVARLEHLEVTPNELRKEMIAEAQRFPGQEKAVVDYYTKTEGALERLRTPLLEEKVVDHILSKTKISETKIPAEELLKMPREMD